MPLKFLYSLLIPAYVDWTDTKRNFFIVFNYKYVYVDNQSFITCIFFSYAKTLSTRDYLDPEMLKVGYEGRADLFGP